MPVDCRCGVRSGVVKSQPRWDRTRIRIKGGGPSRPPPMFFLWMHLFSFKSSQNLTAYSLRGFWSWLSEKKIRRPDYNRRQKSIFKHPLVPNLAKKMIRNFCGSQNNFFWSYFRKVNFCFVFYSSIFELQIRSGVHLKGNLLYFSFVKLTTYSDHSPK